MAKAEIKCDKKEKDDSVSSSSVKESVPPESESKSDEEEFSITSAEIKEDKNNDDQLLSSSPVKESMLPESESDSYEKEFNLTAGEINKDRNDDDNLVLSNSVKKSVLPELTKKRLSAGGGKRGERSNVQKEGGEENKDSLEGGGNDDTGSDVYGQDSKEVSIPETLKASKGKGKAKGVITSGVQKMQILH
eukprot:6376496-Ditylum_brightwellii.AAC.1